jgi:hypothetical protein
MNYLHRIRRAATALGTWTQTVQAGGGSMKRLLFVLAAIIAALAVTSTSAVASASTGAPSTSETVGILTCAVRDNGQFTVPAGSTVTFKLGWFQNNIGGIRNFLQDVTAIASVNGTPVANANSYFTAPEPLPPDAPGNWITWWIYPTGITLAAGQSLTLTLDWVLSRPLADGMPHGVVDPAGDLFENGGLPSPLSCTVTAT